MKDTYINGNYYMVRSPLRAVSFSEKYSNIEESFEEIKKDNIFNEQLLIASPSLYKMIHENNLEELAPKKKKQLISSILSYQNRASYRTTPFGLFSGVELKEINETYQQGNIDIKKHCRVDIEWLLLFIKKIENENYKILNYKLNSAYYKFGDRVYLPYNTESDCGKISIIFSRPFQKIQEMCGDKSTSYLNILNMLKEEYPDRDIEVFNRYLDSLIEKEFLISELRAPLCNTNELEYLINIINKNKTLSVKYADDLEVINKLLMEYEDTKLGEGINEYKAILKKMKSLFNHSKNSFLQVDCEFINLKNNIESKDVKTMSKFINYLFSVISIENSNNILKEYELKFIEKYGEYIEVPIYELLDESIGIGAPSSYNNPENKFTNSEQSTLSNQKLKQYFLEKYSEAIRSNSSIQLDDNEITFLESEIKSNKFPDSLELNFIIKMIDEEKIFYLGPNVGSAMAGKTFGRFGYMSSKYSKVLNNISSLLSKEDESRCELSFIPPTVRTGNVIRNITNYDKNISCYTNSYDEENEIKINNILVGYDNEKFYLRDSSSGKKIKVSMTNMLNISTLPNVFRLLIDISYDSKFILSAFPWEKYYENFTYIPEIRYENIVVSSEKWKISNYSLNLKNKTDYDEFIKRFMELKEKLFISDKVYYTISDNRLLLDLKKEKYLKLLFDYYKKGLYVELEKADNAEYITYNENDQHNTEVVIPFIKSGNKDCIDLNYKEINKNNTKNQMTFLPFDTWLYFKLYGPLDRQNELIEYLNNFIKSSTNIEEFYFMRYLDPKPHIRIRFKGNKDILYKISNEVNSLGEDLKERRIISNLVIDTYIPEVERYGGENLISYAENIFFEDSKVVMEAIANLDIEKEKEKYGVISVLHYLESFNLNFEEQFDLLNNSFVSSEYLEEFKEVRNEYINDCDSYNGWENLVKNNDYAEFLKLLRQREKSILDYCVTLLNSSEHTNEYSDILGSIVHLHCNRLFGIDREFENKVLNYSCRVLHGQKYLRKQMVGNV